MFWRKKRELFEKELELMKLKKLAEIELSVQETYARGEKQHHDYECQWHSERESLKLQLKEIECKTLALKEFENQHHGLLKQKDAEIVRLNSIIEKLLDRVGQPNTVTVNN